MKKYLIVEADTNDADYITSKVEITDEQLEKIQSVIDAIKDFKPYPSEKARFPITHEHNYPTYDCCREDLGEKRAEDLYGSLAGFELFDSFVPCSEHGVHTISRIDLLVIAEEKRLF